jgi:hypothetical protein
MLFQYKDIEKNKSVLHYLESAAVYLSILNLYSTEVKKTITCICTLVICLIVSMINIYNILV